MSKRIAMFSLFLICLVNARLLADPGKSIAWQPWSDDIFARAKAEHKFVLLDLGTEWCHWCHVMDVQTYADPRVIALIQSNYIPVRVDADARPDLANRYEDYGWPATVVYNADGGEIVKRRGFLDPDEMTSMLKAIIADPTPGPSVTAEEQISFGSSTALSPDVRQKLQAIFNQSYDWEKGAWGHGQKFLNWDSVEWSMRLAARGDQIAEKMARQTLDAQLNLLDPAWGGVYQYSTDDDWQHPHFEKIMQMQAENLRIYSLAFAQFHDQKYLHAADAIHNYLTNFLLAPNRGFYTSQDADLVDGVHSADYFALSDADRRKQGIPRIDQHEYSRENGLAISALAFYSQITGNSEALHQAVSAANWVISNRSLDDGGFRHDKHDPAGPYLADTLAMGQAFLQLYTATADRAWLTRAQSAAQFISDHFQNDKIPGVLTAESGPFSPSPEFDENVQLARWANLLNQYTGDKSDRALADSAMKYLATPAIATGHGIDVGGLLLANDEISRPALHLTVVGSKSDPAAGELFKIAMAIPTTYDRLDWFDQSEGPPLNSDVEYPIGKKSAGYVCTATTCSLPAYTPEDYAKRIAAAIRRSTN